LFDKHELRNRVIELGFVLHIQPVNKMSRTLHPLQIMVFAVVGAALLAIGLAFGVRIGAMVAAGMYLSGVSGSWVFVPAFAILGALPGPIFTFLAYHQARKRFLRMVL
jgi:hypothetical protein